MVITETENPKIRFAEGNIFAIEEYGPDSILVVLNQRVNGNRPPLFLPSDFERYKRERPNVFTIVYGLDKVKQPILHKIQVKACVTEMLNHALAQGCRKIGFFGSQIDDDIFVEGARLSLEAIKEWVAIHPDDIDWVTLVDRQGDYNKFL